MILLLKLLIKMDTIRENTTKISEYFYGFIIYRFLLTFIILHSIHFVTSMVYFDMCMDISVPGFFRSMINGHGPICHTLLTICYCSQTNIYTLLGLSTINSGICWVSDKIMNKPVNN